MRVIRAIRVVRVIRTIKIIRVIRKTVLNISLLTINCNLILC